MGVKFGYYRVNGIVSVVEQNDQDLLFISQRRSWAAPEITRCIPFEKMMVPAIQIPWEHIPTDLMYVGYSTGVATAFEQLPKFRNGVWSRSAGKELILGIHQCPAYNGASFLSLRKRP